MSRNFKSARVVNSVPEEYSIVKTIKCDCGGDLKVLMQSLIEHEKKFYDILSCECKQCKKQREFIFNINSFFGNPMI
ncbi:MAG: hypothetical protein HWN66_07710 [Candidatus Helarchaeota archaeon]|nr:hypothetical protein [Candidatus Helarchaeota archaeon]